MNHYKFYNFDGDSVNMFNLPYLGDHNESIDNVELILGMLKAQIISGIEYDFMISAVEYVEIDEKGNEINSIPTSKIFQEWLKRNKTELHKMIMQNQFSNLEYITRVAFEAGVDSQQK